MDPNVVPEQLALQMQIYALDNVLAWFLIQLPPLRHLNPWAFLRTSNVFGVRRGVRRGGRPDSTASMQSTPSHPLVSLPPHVFPYDAVNVRKTCAVKRGFVHLHALRVRHLELRAPNCRQTNKRIKNWTSFNLSYSTTPLSPHAGMLAQMISCNSNSIRTVLAILRSDADSLGSPSSLCEYPSYHPR